MAHVIWVRTHGGGTPRPLESGTVAELETAPPGSALEVAADEAGPFVPLAEAVSARPDLRDRLAAIVGAPSLRSHGRLRALTALAAGAAFPLVAWADFATRPGLLLGDAVLAGMVAWELRRRAPDVPRVAAASLVALGLRMAAQTLRTCGAGATVFDGVAIVLPLTAGLAFLFLAPTRARVILEVGGRLGLGRPELTRASTAPLASSARARAALVGVALSIALTSGSAAFARAGAGLARCVARLDLETAERLAREDVAALASVARVRGDLALALATVLAFPVASEVVFRACLQGPLKARYGRGTALLVASVASGVAQVVLLGGALPEACLLGLALGVTFYEGGLLAAVAAHVLFRLLSLA